MQQATRRDGAESAAGVTGAVERVLRRPPRPDRARKADGRKLERELGALKSEEWDLESLEDTPLQGVQSLLMVWNETDDRRSILSRKARISNLAGDKEGAKRELKTLHEQVMPQLAVVLKELVAVLADDECKEIRGLVSNWTNMRSNLRPLLAKRLGEHGIDVTKVVNQAEDIIEEQRALALEMEEEEQATGA